MASKIASRLSNCSVVTATILALAGAHSSLAQVAAATSSGPSFGPNSRDSATQTPIKHVIIIIGENRTFDHVFATYVPVKPSRDTVWNLLSEGIVKADGTPGPSYSKAIQSSVFRYLRTADIAECGNRQVVLRPIARRCRCCCPQP